MQEFQTLDSNRYPLKTERSKFQINKSLNLNYHRWEHRATIGHNTQTFIVMLDNGIPAQGEYPKVYIEEHTASGLQVIEDDNLFDDLLNFVRTNRFIDMLPPMMK